MQGIYVNFNRPASKKAIKEAVAANPASVDPGNDHGDGPTADAWTDVFKVLPCCLALVVKVRHA